MKRILSSLACVAIAALVGTGVASAAQKHTRHHATSHVAVAAATTRMADAGSCPVSNPALCGSHCPLSSSATAVSASAPAPAKAKAKYSYAGKACPVSDPSQCPASCPRTSANSAVAAKVASR